MFVGVPSDYVAIHEEYPKFMKKLILLTLKWSGYSVLPLVVKGGPYGP